MELPTKQLMPHVYSVGPIYYANVFGRPVYYDRLEEAVEKAKRGLQQRLASYKRPCVGLENVQRALAAITATTSKRPIETEEQRIERSR